MRLFDELPWLVKAIALSTSRRSWRWLTEPFFVTTSELLARRHEARVEC